MIEKYPIRILHVLTAMNRAGTETMLMNLYRNINREKIQFDFAVSADNACDYDEEIICLGGRIVHYPKYRGYNHVAYERWWHTFFKNHPEYKIIHGHIGSTAAIYLQIAKKYGRYAIAHSHSTDAAKLTLHSIGYKIYSYRTRYIADYFFGCSKDALIHRYGKKVTSDAKRSRVFNNAIDVSKFVYNKEVRQKVRQELDINEECLVLGTVGRLTVPKNPYGIIKIVRKLRKQNQNFVFLWIGVGELEIEIRHQIQKEGLEKNIKMLGVRSDVERILQAMDIFLFPSFFEGLGNVAIEAQAAGLPTLCNETLPKELHISDLCIFLPLEPVEKWVEAILEHQRDIRKDMFEDIIKAGYDVHTTAKWLQNFYMDKFME